MEPMPIRCVDLDFTEDGYPGFTAKGRINLPMGLARRVGEINEGTDETEARDLWLKLFPEWNFVDEEGEPIPHKVDGFDAIPSDLLMAMLTRRVEALREGIMPVPLGIISSPVSNGDRPAFSRKKKANRVHG